MKSSRYAKKMSDDSIDEDAAFDEPLQEEFDSNGEVTRVSNLTFVDGELGRGAYGCVRLAKRRIEQDETPPASEEKRQHSFFPPMPISPFSLSYSSHHHNHPTPDNSTRSKRRQRSLHQHLTRSLSEPANIFFGSPTTTTPNSSNHHHHNNNNNNEQSPSRHRHRRDKSDPPAPRTPKVVSRLGLLVRNPSGESARGSFYVDKYTEDDDEELVAVKIFRKSLLKRMRTMERNKETRKVQVKTALMKVEREIAIMKKLSHPNLISLYDVLDSPESDRLYLVIEYCQMGEILTYQNDGTFRRKEPKDGHTPLACLTPEGHFNEESAALFFVDILHGLAYLHSCNVCHRDLKPENILIAMVAGVPVAKLGDFGVSHMFEDQLPETTTSSESNDQESITSSGRERDDAPLVLTKHHVERALSMGNKSDTGLLTKTEGTWCFWSPEMCAGGKSFSGYACDVWAAGVCLYVFTTGRLPFFSELPLELMETIAEGNVPYEGLNLSDSLLDLLKMILEKDPSKRAGVGDCLQHPFLEEARQIRVEQLSEEYIRRNEDIVVGEDDLRAAFQVVTRIPSVLIKSAAKQVESAGKRLVQLTRGASTSSVLTEPSFSDATNGNVDQPATLAAINSGSADEDSYVADMSLGTPDSSVCNEKKSKPRRHSHHHHRNPRKFFGSIFRKKHLDSQSARELTTKNTC